MLGSDLAIVGICRARHHCHWASALQKSRSQLLLLLVELQKYSTQPRTVYSLAQLALVSAAASLLDIWVDLHVLRINGDLQQTVLPGFFSAVTLNPLLFAVCP